MFIRTERLFLRPAWAEDAGALAAAIGHAEVAHMLARVPHPYSLDDARAFLAQEVAPMLPNLLITLPEQGGEIIGGCGLHEDGGQVAVGYWITPAHWGRGYATEALCGLVQIASQCRHPVLTGYHAADNPASGSVLRKAGFCPTGAMRQFHSVARGHDVPGVEYALSLQGEHDAPPPVRNMGAGAGACAVRRGWPGHDLPIRAAA